jgi:hypothetical protein
MYDPGVREELGTATSIQKIPAVLWYRYAKRLMKQDSFLFNTPPISNLPLSVVIISVPGDPRCLPLTVSSVRENIRHPVERIIVLGHDRPELQQICFETGCKLADPNKLFPFHGEPINYRVLGFDMSEHLLHELAKLVVDNLTTTEHILVIDSDTILLGPHIFVDHERVIRLISTAFHRPYARSCKRLLGGGKRPYYMSFDTHYMLFEKTALNALRSRIEQQNSLPWYQAVIQSLDSNGEYAFSAQEIYGNFTLGARNVRLEYAYNLRLPTNQIEKFEVWKERMRPRVKSVTFLPWYHTFAGGGLSDEAVLRRYGIA